LSDDTLVTINVTNVDEPPNAVNDSVFTNVNGNGSSFLIPEAALLLNDTDPDSVLDVTATSGLSDLTSASLLTDPGSVTVVNNDTDGGSFTYTATGGAQTDTASVSVTVDSSGTLSGNGSDNIIIGSSADQTIEGGGGRDIMYGRGGSDTYIFNDGESGKTLATADIISDFDPANDHINLSAVDAGPGGGDQDFSDAGNGGFTQNAGVVAHGVTWHQQGADTVVQMDTDGNTASVEMMIVLTGINANNLHASNFTG
jgi:Ca2+-binding RTX toxin-like protein